MTNYIKIYKNILLKIYYYILIIKTLIFVRLYNNSLVIIKQGYSSFRRRSYNINKVILYKNTLVFLLYHF